MSDDKLCIDLCSGLGGFSRAFVDAGWEVVTVDIQPRFQPTICADLLRLSAKAIQKATKKGGFKEYSKVVVVGSPPCPRFSIADSDWPKKGIGESLRLVGAFMELVVAIKPDYWCMENPKGRLRWFIGKPPHSVRLSDYGHDYPTQGGKLRRPFKPTDLWGNIPFPLLEAWRVVEPKKGGPGWKDESANRAKMPLGLSQAVLEALSESPP